jgi:hypothetical protein
LSDDPIAIYFYDSRKKYIKNNHRINPTKSGKLTSAGVKKRTKFAGFLAGNLPSGKE